MFEKQVLVTAAAAAVVFVGIALAPANADNMDRAAAAGMPVGVTATAPLNSTETPQDQVWDMTYGTERTSETTIELAALATDEAIVDYTFG